MYRRFLKRVGFVLFITLLCSNAQAYNADAQRYYEDAVARFNAGDHKAALIQLKNSLQQDPDQLPAKILLGRTYLALREAQAAEDTLIQAQLLGADPGQVALPLAKARNLLGKYRKNTETIQPAGQIGDTASRLWVELGTARLGIGDNVGAGIAFSEALKLDPILSTAKLGQIALHIEEREFEEAEKLASEILIAEPGNAEAWFMMGKLLAAKDQYAGAERHFAEALKLEPGHKRAALAQALVIMNRGRPAEAAPLFEKILEEQPWSLEAAYLLSRAEARAGRPEASKQALQKASDLVSLATPKDLANNPSLLLLSSLVGYRTEQYESAFQFLTTYLQQKPRDVRARKQRARLFAALDKPLEAIRELRALAIERPKDAQVQIMLGDINVQLKDYTSAEAHYTVALSLTTATTKLVSRIGLAQHGKGRTDLAIQTMQRLVDLVQGESGHASIFLALLYINVGNLAAASEVIDYIAKRQPDNLLAINLKAVVSVTRGDREEGRHLLNDAVARDPSFVPARVNLIKLDILEHQFERALVSLERFLQEKPDNDAGLRTYAEYWLAKNDRRKAIQSLEKIRDTKPSAVFHILFLATQYELDDRPRDALATLVALDKVAPNEIPVLLELARLRLVLGDDDEARSILADAAQQAGSNPVQRVAVAELQLQAKAYDEAIRGMRIVLTDYPEDPEAQLILAHVNLLQGQLLQADDMASKVVTRFPSSVAALSLLAEIRLSRRQTGDAIGLLRRAKVLDDTPEVTIALYRALQIAEKHELALQELATWHQENPGVASVMGVLADHYNRVGNLEKALPLYRQLAELTPADPAVHNNLALALLPLDSEQALESALRAQELAPTSAEVLDTVGWVLVQVGDLETGLARLREAVTRNGRIAEIRYHLAVALEEYGNLTAAEKELRRALASGQAFDERAAAEKRLQRLQRLQP